MTEQELNPGAAAAAPAPQTQALNADPLAVFQASRSEAEGVMVDVEDPSSGELLMRWRLARFGGLNNAAIVREERKLKAKLPQGVRRQIDAGGGDPEIVQRLNRQVFVRVSCLGWEMIHPALKSRYGSFTHELADEVLERYQRMYEQLSEQALDEQNFAKDQLNENLGN